MKYNNIKIILLFFLGVFLIISCKEDNLKKNSIISDTAPDLNNVTINLPDAPGHQTFMTYCTICHSARLVQNQPDFPEKTWASIVTKMQKNYGAPITDSNAKVITQYLVTIKGKK